jgi:hypothetical protein
LQNRGNDFPGRHANQSIFKLRVSELNAFASSREGAGDAIGVSSIETIKKPRTGQCRNPRL